MSDFSFDIDIEGLLNKLASNGEISTKMKIAVGVYCDTTGKKMAAEAKKNATWKDRTGNARQTIEGGFKWQNENKCVSYVAGNMEYSPYLELSNSSSSADTETGMEVSPTFSELELGREGKYAILRPTVRKLTPEFINGMSNLLGK